MVGLSIEISKYFVIIAFQDNFWFVLIPFLYMVIFKDVCTEYPMYDGHYLLVSSVMFFIGQLTDFSLLFSLSDSVSRFSYPLHRYLHDFFYLPLKSLRRAFSFLILLLWNVLHFFFVFFFHFVSQSFEHFLIIFSSILAIWTQFSILISPLLLSFYFTYDISG